MLKQKLRRALARINASRRPAGRQVRKVSCREVAKAANVSYNTVSRHLPNDARVRTRRINHNAPNTREQQLDCDRAARLFAR
jgi:transposase